MSQPVILKKLELNKFFYEDLQDLLELTPQKDVLFIIGDWNAKVGSQETPGVTGKFDLGVQKEARQRLIEFCQKNALVIANTRISRRDKKAFLSDQCKEIEENSRMKRLAISSRKLEIPREHFMQRWAR